MSRSLLLDSLGATIAVFIICGLLKLVVFNISFMDPVHSALHHVGLEFENHVHAGTLAPSTPFSPPICLVDIGSADRSQIAVLLDTIARQNPRVMAVDIVFDKKEAPTDEGLRRSLTQLAKQKKLVMASWLAIGNEETHEETSLSESDAPYQLGLSGYTNFVANESDGVVRHFLPQLGKSTAGQPDTVSFAAQVINIAAPKSWQAFQGQLQTNYPVRILYQPDSLRFIRFTEKDITTANSRLALMRDAIVMVGSMAGLTNRYVPEDVHRVPLGENTYLTGLEVHANIVAMLLQGSYLYHIPDWVVWILSFPLCWGLMLFFVWQFQRYHLSFHLVFKTVQFTVAAIVVLLGLCLFRFAQIEVNTLPLLIPAALAVDVLYFYESFARWFSNWLPKHKKMAQFLNYETYFTNAHTH